MAFWREGIKEKLDAEKRKKIETHLTSNSK